ASLSWTADRAGFCALLERRDLDVGTRLRQQLAVLLANVCADELSIRDTTRMPVGVDPDAEASCRVLGTRSIRDIAVAVDSALAGYGPSTSIARRKALELLVQCVARVNLSGQREPKCAQRITPIGAEDW